MKIPIAQLPALALGASAFLLCSIAMDAEAFVLSGDSLALDQRHYSVFNNFTDPSANNNSQLDSNFPGHQGALMAIWKGIAEWGSLPHGTGAGDPTQASIGSGGANFDSSFQADAPSVGNANDNVLSEISGSSGGILGFCELPSSDGWRIRFYSGWTWSDGPNVPASGQVDLQAVTCHLYGHALGLDHTSLIGPTMSGSYSGSVPVRSLQPDDIQGLIAVYGPISATKPRITALSLTATQLTITGANFSTTGNEVWFTAANGVGTGTPVKVTNVSSNTTTIVVSLPALAGPGDVLVRSNGTAYDNLSNAWPTALAPDTGICMAPVPYCQSLPNSASGGAIIRSNNTPSLLANNFELFASGLPTNRMGRFIYGPTQRDVTFGDGRLCLGNQIYRLPVQRTTNLGEASLTLDYTAGTFSSGSGQAIPGNTMNFQFWFRDPNFGGSGFNTTDGLEVKFCD
jgi:hypothetical protein